MMSMTCCVPAMSSILIRRCAGRFSRNAMPSGGWLIGGTVVVESVFALPGMGQLLVRAIFSRDYMVVQGVAMVFACATVLVNFLADILTVAADPRVRL